MADTVWRCSQCGAINEPGSRACVQCGKWPSLFDLQDNVEEPELEAFEDDYEVETFDPGSFEPDTVEPKPFVPGAEPEDEPERPRWKSILSGVIVPLALLVYFLISLLSDR